MTERDHLLATLAAHYDVRSIHPEFRERFGSRFTYAVPSSTAGFSKINPNGPEPREYIVFARADVRRADQQGCINALSNAKRGVHLSVESLVQLYRLSRYARKAGFPGLLQLLQQLEVFPTRLMAVLNRRRNVMEHEYAAPTYEETTEFVEMAELFVDLCYRFFRAAVIGVYVGEESVCREYRIDPIAFALAVSEVSAPSSFETPDGTIHYNILKETPRVVIKQVPLDADNQTEWAPIVSLLAHCTNSGTYRLSEFGRPGEIVPTLVQHQVIKESDEHGRTLIRVTSDTFAPVSPP